jgi:SAM-dependent methyltransferase
MRVVSTTSKGINTHIPGTVQKSAYGEFFDGESRPAVADDDWSFLQITNSLRAPRRLVDGLQRRWRRERRRRVVGRAYDMALEIAQVIPSGRQVLDVGCGNGFIAHHLSALLGSKVVGIDLSAHTSAPITYQPYNGVRFPVTDQTFDAILLCYVLHHAQDVRAILAEIRRTLRGEGLVVIYEDMPETMIDQAVCWSHNLQWRRRTGPCTFRLPAEWLALFQSAGFKITGERRLSRWRNVTHPVSRRMFVLQLNAATDHC